MIKHFAKFRFVSYFYLYFYCMRKIYYFLVLVTVPLLLNPSCKRTGSVPEQLEADYIEYQVNYLESMAGDIPTKMLPDIMKSYYSKRYIMTSINGFFGQFSLVQVADLRKNTVTTMLNFFGNKVYYTGEKGEIPAGIAGLENPRVSLTNDTVQICGMVSKKAIIETDDEQFEVYFTEEIDIESPNITTPYRFIEHVLSDFRVQLSILKMQLVMHHHEKTTVGSDIFAVPDDYEQVSKETMEAIINSLFTKD